MFNDREDDSCVMVYQPRAISVRWSTLSVQGWQSWPQVSKLRDASGSAAQMIIDH